MVRRILASLISVAALASGCQGARSNDLLADAGAGLPSNDDTGEGADGSATLDGTIDDADTVPTDEDAADGHDDTHHKDAGIDGSVRDAHADAHEDARVTDAERDGKSDGQSDRDASADADAQVLAERAIECGSYKCQVGTEVCCRTRNAQTAVFTCTPPGACPTSPDASVLAIPCDHNDDCAAQGLIGNVCCVSFGTGIISRVACTPIAQCVFATTTTTFMCNPARDDAFNCPAPTGSTDLECTPNPSISFPYGLCRAM